MWNSCMSPFYIMHGIRWCMIIFFSMDFFFYYFFWRNFIIKCWNFETYVKEALFYVIILYFWNINFPTWCKNEHKNFSQKNYSNTWLRKLNSVATYFLPDLFGLSCENIRSYNLNQDFSNYSMKWCSSICHFWVKRQQRWSATHFSLCQNKYCKARIFDKVKPKEFSVLTNGWYSQQLHMGIGCSPITLVMFKRKIYKRDNIHQIARREILNEIRKMVRDWWKRALEECC